MKTLRQCADRQEWDDYVLENGGHPLQIWGWGEVKAGSVWQVDRLFMTDDGGQITGAAQLLIRHLPWPFKSLVYVPRGPVIDESNKADLLGLLSDYAKKTYHAVVLKIEPDDIDYPISDDWEKSTNTILPAETIILDLNKTTDELLADMAKKTRQYIRKADSESVEIKRVHSREDLDKCLDIYRLTAKRAKFNLHSDQYYHDVFDKMGDNAPIFAAYSDGQPIAYLWLAISSSTAFELYGGMNDQGRDLRANYALKWHAIRKCKEWGLVRYDFGGLIEGGVSTFKLGWASQQTKLVGTFDRPLSIFYGIWNVLMPMAKSISQKIRLLIRH